MPRVHPTLKIQAGQGFLDFENRLLKRRGSLTRIANAYARVIVGPAASDEEAARCAWAFVQRLSKSRRRGNHPEPASLWELSRAFCAVEETRWVVPPVLYYVAGWLEALVETIGTMDFAKIGHEIIKSPLLVLRDIERDRAAQRTWAFESDECPEFLHPDRARETFSKLSSKLDNENCDLRIAHILASRLDLPYDVRRRLVLQFLKKWAIIDAER